MPLPELTLAEMITAVQKIVSTEPNAQNAAQTEAIAFISRVIGHINTVSRTYSSLDPKFKNRDSEPFLRKVIAGALLFQLMNIIETHPESYFKSECLISRQIIGFFEVNSLSNISPEEATLYLEFLSQFIRTLNNSRLTNSPIWIKDVPTSILIQLILNKSTKYSTWISDKQKEHQEWALKQQQEELAREEERELIAFSKHVTAVNAMVGTVNTAVQTQKGTGLNRYLGSLSPYQPDPLIENSINFIKDVTQYSTRPEAKTAILNTLSSDTKPIRVTAFLENVSKGAMLLELIAIAAASAKPEAQSQHLLGKAILEFFKVAQLAEIPEVTVVECLHCLDQFILTNSPEIRWNQVKTNDMLHQTISAELKKRPDWVLVEAECTTQPVMEV